MRPRSQVTADSLDLVSAPSALGRARPVVNVIECGTTPITAEGLQAVREIQVPHPGKTILADVRIIEVGSLISRHCFEVGATWVSCVLGTPLATIGQVVKVAAEFGGEVQVELGESYDAEHAKAWRKLGMGHVIVKRSRDREVVGDLSWGPDDLVWISELTGLGSTVTITGGIRAVELGAFASAPVGVVIARCSVMGARDPLTAAQGLQEVTGRTWP